jgi:hypothetical protein
LKSRVAILPAVETRVVVAFNYESAPPEKAIEYPVSYCFAELLYVLTQKP